MVVRNGIPIMFKDRSTMDYAMRTTNYGDLYETDDLKQYRYLCKRLAFAKFYYVKKRYPDNKLFKVKVLPENIFDYNFSKER
jgi:hypothetical protein